MQKLYVIKIGGNVIDDPTRLEKLLSDLSLVAEHKILVHGGGNITSEFAQRLGISQAMVNGRRITDAETLKIAVMVYAGLLNKQIVAKLQSLGVNALGLSGADMNLISAEKRKIGDIDFGFVGDLNPGSVNTNALKELLKLDVLPVFSAITHDGSGQLLNTNADTIAAALSVALSGVYDVRLHFCFEKKGVLSDPENDEAVIERMNITRYKEMKRNGSISKGMIPKMDNAFEAIGKGVKKVVIGHSDDLLNTLQNENIGTTLFS